MFANVCLAKFAGFGTITEEFYDSVFNINAKGLLFTVQKPFNRMDSYAGLQ